MPPVRQTTEMPISQPESRPNPDPSTLTTQALYREISSLKELLFVRLDAMDKAMSLFNDNITRVPTDTDKQISHLKELHDSKILGLASESRISRDVIGTRLDAMDKAIGLVQAEADRMPQKVEEKLAAINDIHGEKFASVQTQFRERDTRTEQSSKDSKVAVDAALQAAKEAVGEQNKSSALAIAKSETGTTKQIDQMGVLIQTGSKALDDKIDDLKERLTRIEGKEEGGTGRTTSSQASGHYVAAIVAAGVGVLSLLVTVAVLLLKH